MTLRSGERFKITIFTLGITIFLWMGFLGLAYFTPGMQMNEQANNCPFMGVAALCAMNPLGHLVMWKEMFTALPQQSATSFFMLLLLLLSLIFTLFFHLRRKIFSPLSQKFHLPPRFEYIQIKTPLHEAFSNGIINPKIF